MTAAGRFPVMEIFGPTVQGEGMVIGRKTMFVRTAGCDYACSWCDSAFTWDGTGKRDIRMLTAAEIVSELFRLGGESFSHVTLSGGNPALLARLDELIALLHDRGIEVALETQGSLWRDWFLAIDDLTLSPKPPSSGMNADWAVLDQLVAKLTELNRNYSLKVVVFDETDLAYAGEVHRRYPHASLYLQSGNDDLAERDPAVLLNRLLRRYEWLVQRVMDSTSLKSVRVLPQLHAWLWGNKRGV
ncbi:7-carboxy-7-deazaguanine synthase QueE [Cohnella nanjingensis]|uniref:7-carboxy-7-deazaguanine synthase n=1 Tax=Cohnella nanjingensis TaxID=1387779 RepID=A0A7X0RQV5_9BACL|nr:7-carboxy-7-deazaguanine synthase QueE [Cohnella nanjingensis]MBB6671988.1 7-carboxy-7-deazaguanine synthase QueE [Cohnella nanjingensis]